MPGYRGHLLGGAFTYLTLIYTFSKQIPQTPIHTLGLCLVTLFGALYPDIDIKSKGQKVFYILIAGTLGALVAQQKWAPMVIIACMSFIPLYAPHRGVTHHPYFIIITPFFMAHLLRMIHPVFISASYHYHLFFIAGAISHLILDYGIYHFCLRLIFLR
jgi:hypothetical protein